ncbi:MAG TPA: hypothetical protein VM307_08505 [Egibacteraceae bacterium]|nr:hypothetical protein [Egibacteraceae bacterium]
MADASGAVSKQATPRLPGVINTVAVGIVVSLVAAISLTARQEPPPTVAEFAPQAVEQIKQTLPEQAEAPEEVAGLADGGAAGTGGGGSDPDDPAEPADQQTEGPGDEEGDTDDEPGAPTEEPEDDDEDEEPVEKARVRRCVGDPPRQTEDPESPPCVPYFEGDNGGATYQGVTANEIRVAVANQAFGGTPKEVIDDLVAHFNRRYEFYGRKMVIEVYEPTGGTFAMPRPPDMIADAVKVDEEIKAFASIAYPDRKGSEHHHYDELARRGIISSAYRAQATATADHYREFAPFQWNVMPSTDVLLTNIGDAVCRNLAGKKPQGGGVNGDGDHSGGALGGEAPTERTFGLVYHRNPDGSVPPMDILKGRLGQCGVQVAAEVEEDLENPNGNNVVLTMRDAGVTTVIYVGDMGLMRANYMGAATNQQYFPEWLLSSFIDMDVDNAFQPGNAPPEQSRNVMGLSFRSKLLPRQQMPWYQAIRESDPSADWSGGNYYPFMATYRQLLQLASGIQLAGPNLTPETFAQGLQSADFPNPGAGGPPNYQPAVSYEGRYTATDSASLYFYDPNTPGNVDPGYPGAVCYVNEGRRYRVGSYPTSRQDFFGRCR